MFILTVPPSRVFHNPFSFDNKKKTHRNRRDVDSIGPRGVVSGLDLGTLSTRNFRKFRLAFAHLFGLQLPVRQGYSRLATIGRCELLFSLPGSNASERNTFDNSLDDDGRAETGENATESPGEPKTNRPTDSIPRTTGRKFSSTGPYHTLQARV
uniref:(northern house mosquito) hypothetical protein n=1 Tax=Culex pipiens TaxID=7175 RepID=A0A8D8CUX4_CULPI